MNKFRIVCNEKLSSDLIISGKVINNLDLVDTVKLYDNLVQYTFLTDETFEGEFDQGRIIEENNKLNIYYKNKLVSVVDEKQLIGKNK